jgi:hypothetical protein
MTNRIPLLLLLIVALLITNCSKNNNPTNPLSSDTIILGYGVLKGTITYGGFPIGGVQITASLGATTSANKLNSSSISTSNTSTISHLGEYSLSLPQGSYTVNFLYKNYPDYHNL